MKQYALKGFLPITLVCVGFVIVGAITHQYILWVMAFASEGTAAFGFLIAAGHFDSVKED